MEASKKRMILSIAEWSIFAVVITIVSLLYYLNQPVRSSRVLYMPAGSGASIIAYLQRAGYDVNPLDRWLLRYFGYIQRGWIEIGSVRLRKGDFLYRLTHAKAALVSVTLIPGETVEIFLDQLAERFGMQRGLLAKAYKEAAPFPDGVIWPDTYHVPMGISEVQLIRYLVTASMRKHRHLAKKFFGQYNQTQWFRYVTIASIIQKEAADVHEMPIIAGVIYNRLKKGMPLQMDGALNYGRYSHVKVTKRRIERDGSRFNTYKFKGLPPWPVGSVSLAALKAAVKPANTDCLYFVKGKDGKHIFTKRYSAHLKAIKSVNK